MSAFALNVSVINNIFCGPEPFETPSLFAKGVKPEDIYGTQKQENTGRSAWPQLTLKPSARADRRLRELGYLRGSRRRFSKRLRRDWL